MTSKEGTKNILKMNRFGHFQQTSSQLTHYCHVCTGTALAVYLVVLETYLAAAARHTLHTAAIKASPELVTQNYFTWKLDYLDRKMSLKAAKQLLRKEMKQKINMISIEEKQIQSVNVSSKLFGEFKVTLCKTQWD